MLEHQVMPLAGYLGIGAENALVFSTAPARIKEDIGTVGDMCVQAIFQVTTGRPYPKACGRLSGDREFLPEGNGNRTIGGGFVNPRGIINANRLAAGTTEIHGVVAWLAGVAGSIGRVSSAVSDGAGSPQENLRGDGRIGRIVEIPVGGQVAG